MPRTFLVGWGWPIVLVIVTSFLAFLALFLVVGALSGTKKKSTTEDYLVAGRGVSPWLTALSSVATNNSGFMFIGMIGFTYRDGLQTVWMMVGWILGDLAVWLWVHKRVRSLSGEVGANSVPDLIGRRPGGQMNRPIVVFAGLLTFVLLGGYAAAQLNAGSEALHTLFDFPKWVGAVLGASVVVIYCYAGGLRASIWTDAAQSIVMIVAMALMLVMAAIEVGAPAELLSVLAAQDPSLVDWRPRNLQFGFGLYLLGMFFGGFGAIGQPHILIRSMAIRSPEAIDRARWIYFAWFIPFFIGAIATGLYARALLPGLGAAGSEAAMPELAMAVLPEVLIGLTLAGLFSATMSTADSQILSCSAAVTQDIAPRWRKSYLASKLATLGIAGLALAIALAAEEGVFGLVLISWSLLGASLGPLLLLRIAGRDVSTFVGVAMMVAGLATVLAWQYVLGWDGHVFKLFPGIAAAFAVYGVGVGLEALRRPAPAGELARSAERASDDTSKEG